MVALHDFNITLQQATDNHSFRIGTGSSRFAVFRTKSGGNSQLPQTAVHLQHHKTKILIKDEK